MVGQSSPLPIAGSRPLASTHIDGLYTYSQRIILPVRMLATLLLAIAVAQYALVWLSLIAHNLIINGDYLLYNTLHAMNAGWLAGRRWSSTTLWIELLAGAHLSLAIALPLFALLYNAIPRVWVYEQGLAVQHFNRWLLVPWHQIEHIKAVGLSHSNRFILLFTTGNKYLTFLHRCYSLCFGLRLARNEGFIITSDLKDFDAFMAEATQRIIRARQLRAQAGAQVPTGAVDIIEDNYFAPALKMALDPRATLDEILEAHPLGLADAQKPGKNYAVTSRLIIPGSTLYGVRNIALLALAYLCVGLLFLPIFMLKTNYLGPLLLALLPIVEWLALPPFFDAIAAGYGLHDTDRRITLLTPAMLAIRAPLLILVLAALALRSGTTLPFFILLGGAFWITALAALLFKRVHETADLQSVLAAAMGPILINIIMLILAAAFML